MPPSSTIPTKKQGNISLIILVVVCTTFAGSALGMYMADEITARDCQVKGQSRMMSGGNITCHPTGTHHDQDHPTLAPASKPSPSPGRER
jgi:hypothetical protein